MSHGFASERITLSNNKGWLALNATTSEAEQLLHTEYHVYEHADGHRTTACDQYHVPKHIQEHVDYITPGIKLLAPVKRGRDSVEKKAKRGFGMTSGNGSPLPPKFRAEPPVVNPNSLTTCDLAITPDVS